MRFFHQFPGLPHIAVFQGLGCLQSAAILIENMPRPRQQVRWHILPFRQVIGIETP